MKKIIIICLLIAAGGSLFARGRREPGEGISFRGKSEEFTEEHALNPGGELLIDLRTGGSIDITGWNEERVVIEVTKYGNAAQYADVKITANDNDLKITSQYSRNRISGNGGVDIVIRAPADINLEFNTLGGDVELRNLRGDFSGRTLGGDIFLSQLTGDVDLETLGGDIEIAGSILDGDVKTLGGDIKLDEVRGSLDTSTLGGKVVSRSSDIQQSGSAGTGHETNSSSTEQYKKIDTLGGDIDISEAPEGIEATTLGGDIRIDDAAVFVHADTMGGDIEISSIDGRVYAKTLGGDIAATMTGDPAKGERDVTMSSLGGNIRLTVPEGLDMDIDITLDETWDAKRDYRIYSDFDIKQTETEATRRINGTTHGTGIIGKGTHTISLSTINGDIYLKKGK